jgi:drug/metabolite transporter (DMT)-like permease
MFKYIYIIVYVLLTAVSMVFIREAANFLPPSLTLFLGSIAAIIVFHAINFRSVKSMYQKAWHNKWLWLRMMITIAIVWLACIYGPTLVAPAIFVLLYFAISCLIGIFASYQKEKAFYLIIAGIGVLACTVCIIINYLYTVSISHFIIYGIILGIIGGVINYIYIKQSHAFASRENLTATQVLAVRFWLTLGICYALLPSASFHYINLNSLIMAICVSLASLILPIYFFMKSVIKIGVEKNAIVSGLVPASTYVLQAVIFHHYSDLMLLLNLAAGFFIALPYIMKLRIKAVIPAMKTAD